MSNTPAVPADEAKRILLTRLRKAEGQVRGIVKMVENNSYCDDVLTQIAAAKAALDSASRLVLEGHMRDCIADRLQKGDRSAVEELLATLKKML